MKQTLRQLLVVVSICCGLSAFSQDSATNSNSGGYVKSQDLNVDLYIEFAKAIKADGRYEIDSACIPASVFHVRMKDGSAMNEVQWSGIALIAQSAGLIDFKVQQDYTDNKFMEECSEKRTR